MNSKLGSRNRLIGILKILAIVLSLAFVFVLIKINAADQKTEFVELSEMASEDAAEKATAVNKANEIYKKDMAVVKSSIPGIVCWGDSFTYGMGGEGTDYPSVLQSVIDDEICEKYDVRKRLDYKDPLGITWSDYALDIPVVNMGVAGESSITVAGRSGAIPFVTASGFTIPSDADPVRISIASKNGSSVEPLRAGDVGVNNVTISGIEGVLSIQQTSEESDSFQYFFTRSQSGKEVSVKKGTVIKTAASSMYKNYIPIVFIGANGGYKTTAELISQQKSIIKHQTKNTEQYIIVGLPIGDSASQSSLEKAMQKEYGERYINLREYMSTKALSDAGIEPTAEDKALMAKGGVPESLRVAEDNIHFNAEGYKLTGKLIFERMDSLGYFDEIRTSLSIK